MRRILIIAVAAWQIEMSVECAMHCIVRPVPAAKSTQVPSTQCKEGKPCPPPQPQPQPIRQK